MASKGLVALNWVLQVLLGLAIPIASIVIAAVYHGQCAAEPMINVYLYVAGVIGFVSFAYAIIFFCCVAGGRCENEGCLAGNACLFLVFEIIIGLFNFAWFIAGSVWVYRNYGSYKDGTLDCHKTLYLFAFSILTIQWILFALKTIIGCCTRKESEE